VLCEGRDTLLSVIANPNASYQWKKNGAFVGNNSSELLVNSAGSYQLLTSNPQCGNKTSQPVVVSLIPTNLNITSSGSPIICGIQSLTLQTEIIPGANYSWSKNGVSITGNTSSVLISSGGTYSVTVTSFNTTCAATASIIIDQIAITPTITPSSPVVLCPTLSNILATQLVAGANYQWKKDGNFIGGNTNTLSVSQTGNYTVLITKNACILTSNISYVSKIPTSTTISAATSTNLCPGQTVVLSTTNLVGVTYQWKKNGANIGINANQFTATTAGIYSVIMSKGTECTVTSPNIQVFEITKDINLNRPGNVKICIGDSIQLSTPILPNVNYVWKKNNLLISGANTNSLVVKQTGQYKVEVTDLGCVFISDTLILKVAIDQILAPVVQNFNNCEGTAIPAGSGLIATPTNCPLGATFVETYVGPTVGYDGGSISGVNPKVTVQNKFGNITKLKIKIVWEKKDQGGATSCGLAHAGGSPYNEETQFQIKGPNNQILTLIQYGTYSGNYAGVVTTTFDDNGTPIIVGSSQSTGTFKPQNPLSGLNGISPNGVWELLPNDGAGSDPLCVSGFAVDIETNNGFSPPATVKWFSDPTSTTVLNTNTVFAPNNVLPGTYTYYVSSDCLNSCESPRAPVTYTIIPLRPVSPSVKIKNGTNILQSPITYCPGQAFELEAIGCVGGTLNWSNSSSANSFIVNPTDTQNYSVICNVNNGYCINQSLASNVATFVQSPTDLLINTTLSGGLNQNFWANYLRGNSLIQPSSIINYSGQNAVVLEPGFSITGEANHVFKAFIGSCPN
jgi:hypothetical protein